jgi:hypothetical protein
MFFLTKKPTTLQPVNAYSESLLIVALEKECGLERIITQHYSDFNIWNQNPTQQQDARLDLLEQLDEDIDIRTELTGRKKCFVALYAIALSVMGIYMLARNMSGNKQPFNKEANLAVQTFALTALFRMGFIYQEIQVHEQAATSLSKIKTWLGTSNSPSLSMFHNKSLLPDIKTVTPFSNPHDEVDSTGVRPDPGTLLLGW